MNIIDKLRYIDLELGVYLRHLTAAELKRIAEAATELSLLSEEDREDIHTTVDDGE